MVYHVILTICNLKEVISDLMGSTSWMVCNTPCRLGGNGMAWHGGARDGKPLRNRISKPRGAGGMGACPLEYSRTDCQMPLLGTAFGFQDYQRTRSGRVPKTLQKRNAPEDHPETQKGCQFGCPVEVKIYEAVCGAKPPGMQGVSGGAQSPQGQAD